MTKRKNLIIIIYIFLFLLFSEGVLFAQTKQFELYGYGQVDFSASNKSGSTSGFEQRRLNLISEFFPNEKTRILVDVEYEGGADLDVGDSSYHGTIKLSRGWIEYTVMPELKIRAGKMLTAFGLYNLVHDASASYFPLEPPIMYSNLKLNNNLKSQRLYAKYTIGVEFLGTLNLNNSGSQIDYSISIGNGRGLKGNGTDINNGRSISYRVVYRPSSISGFQVGNSFYFDKNYYGFGGVQNDKEYTAGIDIQYENKYFQLQSEGLLSNFKNSSEERQNAAIGYTQFVYYLSDELSPYINYSMVFFDIKNGEPSFTRTNVGINWSVSPYLYLKSEIQFHDAEEDLDNESFNVFKISAAFAF